MTPTRNTIILLAGLFALSMLGFTHPAEAQYAPEYPVVDTIEVFATAVGLPAGLTLADDGTILIGDFHNPGYIRKATLDGSLTLFADGIRSVGSIVVHPSGNIYATSEDNTIEVTGPEGGEMLSFASGLSGPAGLIGDHLGDLYVVNNGSGTISRINADGIPELFATGFNDPVGLTTDACGNIFLASRGDDAVMILDGLGESEVHLDSIDAPHSVAFDQYGNLFVSGFDGITVVTPSMERTLLQGTESLQPLAMAFDAAGRLYVSCWDANVVRRITLAYPGGIVESVTDFATITAPSSLVFQPNGDLLVSNFYDPGPIEKITPAGAVSTYGSGATRAVTGISRDSAGYVYGGHQDGTVRRIPPGGGTQSIFLSGQANVSGTAVDADGRIYVVDHNTNSVRVYAVNGGAFIKEYTDSLYGPVGCVLDDEGNLYVANRYTNSIVKIAQDGSAETFVSNVSSPHSMVWDAWGNLFVSVSGEVVMVKPDKSIRHVSSAFTAPLGLAFDADGDLYVADWLENRVRKVTFK